MVNQLSREPGPLHESAEGHKGVVLDGVYRTFMKAIGVPEDEIVSHPEWRVIVTELWAEVGIYIKRLCDTVSQECRVTVR